MGCCLIEKRLGSGGGEEGGGKWERGEGALPMHQNPSTRIQPILDEGITFREMLNNILAAGIFYFD